MAHDGPQSQASVTVHQLLWRPRSARGALDELALFCTAPAVWAEGLALVLTCAVLVSLVCEVSTRARSVFVFAYAIALLPAKAPTGAGHLCV